jgi:hypothetical protein
MKSYSLICEVYLYLRKLKKSMMFVDRVMYLGTAEIEQEEREMGEACGMHGEVRNA